MDTRRSRLRTELGLDICWEPKWKPKGYQCFLLGGAEEGSGCFDRELGQFTVNSRFWCHGMGVKSLQECMSWKPNTKLDNERRYLRQPPGAKQ